MMRVLKSEQEDRSMNLNNFTQKSLEAVQSARDLAVRSGHQQLEQVHLLLALLQQEGGLVPSCCGKWKSLQKAWKLLREPSCAGFRP